MPQRRTARDVLLLPLTLWYREAVPNLLVDPLLPHRCIVLHHQRYIAFLCALRGCKFQQPRPKPDAHQAVAGFRFCIGSTARSQRDVKCRGHRESARPEEPVRNPDRSGSQSFRDWDPETAPFCHGAFRDRDLQAQLRRRRVRAAPATQVRSLPSPPRAKMVATIMAVPLCCISPTSCGLI